MGINQAIVRAAQQLPHKIAVRGYGYQRNWQQTLSRIQRIAAGLRQLGLQQGDRIALLAGNNVEHFEITHGAIWAGVVVVPINTRLAEEEICEILRDSGSRAFAYDTAHASVGSNIAQSMALEAVVALQGNSEELTFTDLLKAEPMAALQLSSADLLGLYYTGGTTGKPKGVALTHETFHLTAMDQLVGLECNADSIYLHAAPYFHLADCTLGNSITYGQGTHVFVEDLSSQGIVEAITDLGVNFLSLVPTQYQDLIDKFGDNPIFTKIKNVAYGAAPISKDLLSRMIASFPNARMKQCYGQTEIGGACVILPPHAHTLESTKLATAGRATLSVNLRIVDADGKELPRGQAGEVVISGPRIMAGYWQMPDTTSQTVIDGWLHTGDVGVMDEDGYVAIVDRLKDMVVTGGENVFCAEVENTIASHPDVVTVAVVGVPDERWGEAVHAFVVLADGKQTASDDIITYTRNRLAGYKTPKAVTFIDQLPLSGVGKVRKDLLRSYWKTNQQN